MKKLKCLLGALIGFSIIMATSGCTNNKYGLDPKMPTAITVWHYYNSSQKIAFDEMITEFNQTEGLRLGIVVKAYSQSSPNDLAEAVKASASKKVGTEPMPNIFSTYVDTALEIDQSYGLAVLDDYLSEKELSAYVPSYINEGRIGLDNKLKVFPVAKSTEVLMLNSTDWTAFAKSAHVETSQLLTWEGLADVAEKYYHYTNNLTKELNDGKAFFGRDALANYIFIGSKQLGAEILMSDENGGHAGLNQYAMRRIWDNYYIPTVKGYYGKQGRFATDDAKLGNIIALVGSNTGATFFPSEVSDNDSVYPIDLAILPLPNFAGTEAFAVQQGAGMAISKSDPLHEYASIMFLKWFTETEMNLRFAAESAYLPVTKAGSTLEALNSLKQQDDINLTPSVEAGIRASLMQMQAYTMYTSQPVYHGFEVRALLEDSLKQKAETDHEAVNQKIQNGQDRSIALETYLSDDNFLLWYASISQKVDELMERD